MSLYENLCAACISIHALREEGDGDARVLRPVSDVISIHALREEGDRSAAATSSGPTYFYPRPPRGGRPQQEAFMQSPAVISIHALREEGDLLPPLE